MNEALTKLRTEIDAIDDKILKLLEERTCIVEQVGKLKAQHTTSQSYIRPGREASMLRNLMTKIQGKFPQAAVATIWRMVISGSLQIEHPMEIAAYSSPDNSDAYWLAREYFGPFMPISAQRTTTQVVRDVINGKATVGVLPVPEGISDTESWWLNLIEDTSGVHIFAQVPFIHIEGRRSPVAVAIARVAPEPTGDDTSMIALDVAEHISRDNIIRTAEKVGLASGTLVAGHIQSHPDIKHYLMQISGFLSADDSKLQDFAREIGEDKIRIKILGTYANPVTLKG